ncbi:MAG TPA: amino acid ABC transporter permease [Chloroflexi bacterium]|nr:MAG: hypothetical protein B6243_00565 [Anaerolineaceae bacterium 4572_5.2]HEY86315.1 amino acid ABC transporter permease [Chloroflexota bacterium]
MTTATNIEQAYEAPPRSEVGVLGWLKRNLFGSVIDSVLTIISVSLLVWLVPAFLNWAFTTANWASVTTNKIILMQGPYPQGETWRVFFSAGIVAIMAVISLFVYKTDNKRLRQTMTLVWVASPVVLWYILAGFENSALLPKVDYSRWGGLLLTFVLAIFGIIASFPLGVLLALGRRSDLPIIRWLSTAYIEMVRGVPLITVLFMAQVMLPLVLPADARVPGMFRAMVAMALFSAAYLAENVRGGLQAIPKGQSEAAEAIGLNKFQEMYLIIMPQALRTVIPPLVGQFIGLFKDTSLVAIVGLLDLLGIGKSILSQAGFLQAQKEVYLFIALIYFVFSFAMSSTSIRLEKKLGVGQR